MRETSTLLSTAGCAHGFLGRELHLRDPEQRTEVSEFLRTAEAEILLLVRQVHGNAVCDLSAFSDINEYLIAHGLASDPQPVFLGEADALVANRGSTWKGKPCALGIITADCVPILCCTDEKVALIHAGWRGLSNGIIEKTLQKLDAGAIRCAIGPCAGATRYEVGSEVLEAIPSHAIYMAHTQDKFFLDLRGTAEALIRKQCREQGASCKINILPHCTMSDTEFHSFRRDKEAAGRNLSFIRLPSNGHSSKLL